MIEPHDVEEYTDYCFKCKAEKTFRRLSVGECHRDAFQDSGEIVRMECVDCGEKTQYWRPAQKTS